MSFDKENKRMVLYSADEFAELDDVFVFMISYGIGR